MSRFLGLIRALLAHLASPQPRDETFLAQAVDHCDLERRIRVLAACASARTSSSSGRPGALW